MDVVAYLRILRRHWRMIVVAAVLGAVIGAGTTVFTSSSASSGSNGRYYQATHTLFLDTSSNGGTYRPVFNNLDQMAVLATTGDVPQDVSDEVGGNPKELTTHIYISTNGTLSTMDISAAERDPQAAVKLADTFAQALMDSIKAKEQSRLDQLRDDTLRRLTDLQNQIAALDAQIAARPPELSIITAQRNSLVNSYTAAYERFQGIANASDPTSNLSTLQSAQPERISKSEYTARITAGQLGHNLVRADVIADSQQNADELTASSSSGTQFNGPVARGFLGALLGLLIGIGLALVADRIDRRVRTREEFEAAYGMPVLAEIPVLKTSEQRSFELTARTGPLSRAAEAYRAVRSSLLFQRPTSGRGQLSTKALTIMVASATPKEGKSTTSANLATVFAESGQRVLVMNCDFRRPTLHRFFGVENEPRRVLESGIEGLMIVSDVTGPENPNPAHVTEQQRRIITNSQEHFEVVILDTAPLLSTNDATELMDLVDLVLLIGRVGASTSDNALRVRELLSRLDAPVAGVVMIGSDAATNDYYYYYSRGRAKELTRQTPPKSKSDLKRAAKTRNGNGANGSHGEGAIVKPTAAPDLSDG
jgi:Mrp family chromosome partitioning ATPase/capsular polysaccharide biosynthesis protein